MTRFLVATLDEQTGYVTASQLPTNVIRVGLAGDLPAYADIGAIPLQNGPNLAIGSTMPAIQAGAHGNLAVGIGGQSLALPLNGALGSLTTGYDDTAIGAFTSASGAGSVAIGVDHTQAGASATGQDVIALGTANHKLFIPGLPSADPSVAGQLYTAGAPSAGVPKAVMVSGG